MQAIVTYFYVFLRNVVVLLSFCYFLTKKVNRLLEQMAHYESV